MKSFRAETLDQNKRQAPRQVTQDSIAVGFGSVVVQNHEARLREPGITVSHPRSYLPCDTRQRGISLRVSLNVGPELIKRLSEQADQGAPLSAVESAETRVWDRAH